MNKYRFRFEGGRIIGPFSLEQIKNLRREGRLEEIAELQLFPNGKWCNHESILEIKEIFDRTIVNTNDETFMLRLDEIDFLKEGVELQKSEVAQKTEPLKKEVKKKKTLAKKPVATLNVDTKESLDHTKVNPDYKKYLEELKKEEDLKKKKKEEIKKLKEESRIDYENDSTQMISLKDIEMIKGEELSFEELDEGRDGGEKDSAEGTRKEKSKKVKKKKKHILSIFSFLLFVFSIFILLDDEEKVQKHSRSNFKSLDPEISFPSRYDVEDNGRAKTYYKEALQELAKESYASSVIASRLLNKSVQNKFFDNPAMAKLIFTYSDNLRNSREKNDDANSTFKLVQIFKNKAFTDPSFASAISYFYYSIKKYGAALKIIDKYMTLNSKKITLELFSVRLLVLNKLGEFDKGKKVAESLIIQKKINLFTLKSLYEFYTIQDQKNEKVKILKRIEKSYPDSAFLMAEKGVLHIENEDYPALFKLLRHFSAVGSESSRYYYSRYLYLKGMYYAYNKKIKLASKLFKDSLSIYESSLLVEKLALLEEAEDVGVNLLILNSKAKKLLTQARFDLKDNELNYAFSKALEASSIAPEFVDAKLFLAELQIKRGYINDALDLLEKLYKKNSSSLKVLFSLIDGYTEGFKFRKVVSLFNAAQNLRVSQSEQFFMAKAKYSIYLGDLNSGVGWLKRAINVNPLNDENIYSLAKLYFKFHKYLEGKTVLTRAMNLDPTNVAYRVSFAEALYETENSNAAISYLYNVLEDFVDEPKIYGAIGIYYYKSGQIKKYEEVKDKLDTLPKKDGTFYKFLINSARLDDNVEKVIIYSLKLLEVNSGDLAVRLKLASIYTDLQRYKKAKKQLDIIESRFDTYPRLQYLKARLYFLIEDITKAKKLVKKEILENPRVIDGYLLLGDILIKEKRLVEAKKQYLQALKLNPKSLDAILGIAYIAFHSDQYDMALDQYQKALEMNPGIPKIYRLLADAYRKLSQSQLAVKNYKHFLELSPSSKYKNRIKRYIKTME